MSNNLLVRDYEGYKANMIQGLKDLIPEYSDFSDHDPGVVLIQLLATALDGQSYYHDRAVQEVYSATAQNVDSLIKIANMLDYAPDGVTPSRFMQVFEIIPQLVPYQIPIGTKVTTDEVNITERMVFELEDQLTIPAGCTGLEKDTNGNYLYAVSVINGTTVSNSLLGTSDASAYQTFKITDVSVITDSIEVYVDEGLGPVLWTKVDNFLDTYSASQVYRVIFDGVYNYIQFGGGTLGQIPAIFIGGITSTYRIGGGIIGNVGASTITQIVNPLALVIMTTNPFDAYQQGADMESNDDIRMKTPASLMTLKRAVTLADYENLAYADLVYVLKIKALNTGAQQVTLMALTTDNVNGTLSTATHDALVSYYDDKKIINTSVLVLTPVFLVLNFNIVLYVLDNFVAVDTEALVNSYIAQNMTLGNYNFGDELITSVMVRDIMNMVGVKAVVITITNNGGSGLPPDTKTIVKLGTIVWDVRGGI